MEDTPSAGWRRNQFAVTAASFVGFTGFTLVMPFLPLYIAQLGVTDVGEIAMWTGLSLGASPALTALLSPLWGKVGDRFGRKLLVERSLISFVIIMSATAYATRPWHVLVLRCIQGLFAGYGGLCLAMAAESAPRGRMASAIGMVQTAQRLGPALGPVIGGVIAGIVGLRQAFFVTAGFYAVAFLVVLFLYQERRRPRTLFAGGVARDPIFRSGASDEGAPGLSSEAAAQGASADLGLRAPGFREILRLPDFALLMLVLFGLQLADRSYGPLLPLHVAALGVPPERVALASGILFSILACSAALGHHLCGRLIHRVHARRIITGGAFLSAAGAALFVVSQHVQLLPIALAVFGVGIGTASTAAYTTAGCRVPQGAHGSAFGLLTGASLTGLAVTPVFAGLLATITGIRTVFVLGLATLVALGFLVRRSMNDAV